jgi:hypothetical protein
MPSILVSVASSRGTGQYSRAPIPPIVHCESPTGEADRQMKTWRCSGEQTDTVRPLTWTSYAHFGCRVKENFHNPKGSWSTSGLRGWKGQQPPRL